MMERIINKNDKKEPNFNPTEFKEEIFEGVKVFKEEMFKGVQDMLKEFKQGMKEMFENGRSAREGGNHVVCIYRPRPSPA